MSPATGPSVSRPSRPARPGVGRGSQIPYADPAEVVGPATRPVQPARASTRFSTVRRARRRSVLALLGLAGRGRRLPADHRHLGPGGARRTCAPTRSRRSRARRSTRTRGGYGAGRLLVRFDGYVTNVGDGPARGLGQPAAGGSGRQRSVGGRRGARADPRVAVSVKPEVVYETADGHNHFHLKKAMRYSLWNLERTAQVAPGQKVGFCLYDIEDAPTPRAAAGPRGLHAAVTQFCDAGRPGLDRPADGHLGRVARRLRQVASPTSGSTCRTPRPGATWWAPRPTRTTASGRAAAQREINPPAFAAHDR